MNNSFLHQDIIRILFLLFMGNSFLKNFANFNQYVQILRLVSLLTFYQSNINITPMVNERKIISYLLFIFWIFKNNQEKIHILHRICWVKTPQKVQIGLQQKNINGLREHIQNLAYKSEEYDSLFYSY